MLHARPSLRILLSCGLVTIGFFIGVLIDSPSSSYFRGPGSPPLAGTKAPSPIGVVFGLVSSVSTALHAVVIKRSLDAVGGSTLQLAWYSNLVSALVMLPVVFLAGEFPGIMDLLFGSSLSGSDKGLSALATFLWGSAITGFVGFLICIAGFLSIKITSPITHMVSAAVRGVLQTLLSVALFGDVITRGRISSIAIILVGSIYYTWVKNEETIAAQRRFNNTPAVTPMLGRMDDDEQGRLSKMENGFLERVRSWSGGGQSRGSYEPVALRDIHERSNMNSPELERDRKELQD